MRQAERNAAISLVSIPRLSSRACAREYGWKLRWQVSTYQAGRRSPDWLKIKARPQQDFVVGGFTEGKGSHEPAEVICDDCDSSAVGESDQNEVESARSCIPSPALLASS